ncbi:MAG TPA: FHA domain-containing protein [Polyangiaceae bacterium]
MWVDYRGNSHEIRQGETLIGRSSACHIVLDDPLVSRQHARLVVGPEGARVEDAGSVNGMFVNGVRVNQRVVLKDGDRLTIGRQDLVVRIRSAEPAAVRLAETLHGVQAVRALTDAEASSPFPPGVENEATIRGNAFELLGGVAQKVLALGRGEEAERLLGTFLEQLLRQSYDKKGTQDAEKLDAAADFAIRLGLATGKARWIDYTFELFTVTGRLLRSDLIDQLHTVLRKTSGVSLNRFRAYVGAVRRLELGPAERFLLQRIEGLERLVH